MRCRILVDAVHLKWIERKPEMMRCLMWMRSVVERWNLAALTKSDALRDGIIKRKENRFC
jgi:hypothetical protein